MPKKKKAAKRPSTKAKPARVPLPGEDRRRLVDLLLNRTPLTVTQ